MDGGFPAIDIGVRTATQTLLQSEMNFILRCFSTARLESTPPSGVHSTLNRHALERICKNGAEWHTDAVLDLVFQHLCCIALQELPARRSGRT